VGQSRLPVVGAIVVAALLLSGGPRADYTSGVANGSVGPKALLVVAYGAAGGLSVAAVTLGGKRVAVPARVRESPGGLSADARMVAKVSGDSVLLGAVRGGSMKRVLTGKCVARSSPLRCSYGSDPSFVWSPTSQRLAVAANRERPPTLLALVDRSGSVVRGFTLPRTNPERGGRAYYHLVSWSPDGSRLLAIRRDEYIDTAVVVLEVKTGTWRTLARIVEPHDSPRLSWSPDGRFVALTSEGRSSQDFAFAVIDASSGHPILACKVTKIGCGGGTVWASDSQSLFITAGRTSTNQSSRIERFYVSGRRSTLFGSKVVLIPRIALATSLIYEEYSEKPDYSLASDALYRYDFASGNKALLHRSRTGIGAVIPLSRLP